MKYVIKYVQDEHLYWLHKTSRGYEAWIANNGHKLEKQYKDEAKVYDNINDAYKNKTAIDGNSWYYTVDEAN